MLESMISQLSDRCTRHEGEDIASSVQDGIDSFILTHETSIGRSPARAVEQLSKIILEAENITDYRSVFSRKLKTQGCNVSQIDTLITTACNIAAETGVDLMICMTETGDLPRYLSKYNMEQTILACSTDSTIVRQVSMLKGVVGHKIPSYFPKFQNKLIELFLKIATEEDYCDEGSKIMIFTALNEGKQNESVNFVIKTLGGLEEEEEGDEEVLSGD
jgi:pyruvate kinase